MNSRTALLAALALDALLAAAIVFLLVQRPAPLPIDPARTYAPSHPLPPNPAPLTTHPSQTPNFDWRVVESEDYKKYIANLRAIGCPDETIRDIITADVNKLFESRRKALRKDRPAFQFWKAGSPMAGLMDPELIQKQQELNREKRDLLVELLGSAPEEKPDLFMAGMNPFETMLDFLPASKQAQIMDLMQKQQTKMMKLVGSGGILDAEDMKKARGLQRESDARLAQLLTPAEFEDYQLRMSQTAMMMRFSLGSFEPTEQEFREIFKLRKPFDEEYSQFMDGTDSAFMQRRAAAESEAKEAIRKLLGETRYAEYERSQDFNYQQLSKLAERQGLSRDATVQAYDMSRTAQRELQRVQQNQTLTADQRQTALNGIRAETERSLRQVLGDQAYDGYLKQPTTHWLRSPSEGGQPTDQIIHSTTILVAPSP